MTSVLITTEVNKELPSTNLAGFFYTGKSFADARRSARAVYDAQKAQLYKVAESYNIECPKCKGNNTNFVMDQFRSADEGQEGLLTCKDCLFRDKIVVSKIT